MIRPKWTRPLSWANYSVSTIILVFIVLNLVCKSIQSILTWVGVFYWNTNENMSEMLIFFRFLGTVSTEADWRRRKGWEFLISTTLFVQFLIEHVSKILMHCKFYPISKSKQAILWIRAIIRTIFHKNFKIVPPCHLRALFRGFFVEREKFFPKNDG